jgi:para-nitrobenzyl esterase
MVATEKGLVKGKQEGTGFAFLGIPYAAPPVATLRFQPPVPGPCWSGAADASNYSNKCARRQQWRAWLDCFGCS